MLWTTKIFNELTKEELYQILRLRAEVFVVEQDCVYQDVDNKDQKALHVFFTNQNKVIAYTRIFKSGDYFEQASIGRVVVAQEHRKDGLGFQLMEKSIEAVQTHFNETTIKISAQLYLKNFYESLGFKQIGEGYLEDGIPHIAMLRK